ncbi:uncharacterized protein LOC116212171 [Punica granatum]|uniref:Uncharacterized protein LOC116212171 n=1 Tax=Punica granatum TaxID=22663 RepID=A0A6P8EB71_PUNGR|nr:uncharacterized protein LOC116212171 [Punica granatum]
MGLYKAPLDGFYAIFYQSNWETIWPSVFESVRKILDESEDVALVNETPLVLIPKLENLESIHHFLLISLCNVSYKLVTKVIANRLQGYMAELVSPNQASGEKIIAAKTSIFFSRNDVMEDPEAIYRVSSFTATNTPGSYFGVQLVHERVSKEHFS